MYLRASECNPRGLGSCQRKITSSLLIAMSTSMALAPNFKADLVAAKVFSQCPRGSPPACPITKKSCFLLCWQNDPGKSQLFPFLRWYKKAILYRSDFCCIYLPSGGVIMTDLGVMNTMNTICQEDDYTGKVEQSSWEHIWSTMTHCSKSSFFVQKFNFDFPRKLSIFSGEKLMKMLWFRTF